MTEWRIWKAKSRAGWRTKELRDDSLLASSWESCLVACRKKLRDSWLQAEKACCT
jgi:hypothetical protein